jgi:hypothetical protein
MRSMSDLWKTCDWFIPRTYCLRCKMLVFAFERNALPSKFHLSRVQPPYYCTPPTPTGIWWYRPITCADAHFSMGLFIKFIRSRETYGILLSNISLCPLFFWFDWHRFTPPSYRSTPRLCLAVCVRLLLANRVFYGLLCVTAFDFVQPMLLRAAAPEGKLIYICNLYWIRICGYNTCGYQEFWDLSQTDVSEEYIVTRNRALLATCFLALFIFRLWRWWRHVSPKLRLSFNRLHGITFQKTELCFGVVSAF